MRQRVVNIEEMVGNTLFHIQYIRISPLIQYEDLCSQLAVALQLDDSTTHNVDSLITEASQADQLAGSTLQSVSSVVMIRWGG